MDMTTLNAASQRNSPNGRNSSAGKSKPSADSSAADQAMSDLRTAIADVQPGFDGVRSLPLNVNDWERIASVGIGIVALFFLARRLLIYLAMAGIGAYLIVRGVTGHCMLYSRAHLDTRDLSSPTKGESPIDHGDQAVDTVTEASRESFPASDPPPFYR